MTHRRIVLGPFSGSGQHQLQPSYGFRWTVKSAIVFCVSGATTGTRILTVAKQFEWTSGNAWIGAQVISSVVSSSMFAYLGPITGANSSVQPQTSIVASSVSNLTQPLVLLNDGSYPADYLLCMWTIFAGDEVLIAVLVDEEPL